MNTASITPKALSPNLLLSQSLSLYRASFFSSLAYSIPATLLIFLPKLLAFIFVHNTLLPDNFYPQSQPWINATCWSFSLIFVLALIFKLYCQYYQIPCQAKQALSQALSRSLRLVLLAVLYAIVVLGGTMFLVIPGIVLAVSLMFCFILMMTQDRSMLQTLITSHQLVWPHWWYSFIVISIPILLNIALYLSLFTSGVLLSHGLSFGIAVLSPMLWLLTALLQICLLPLVLSVATVLKHDLEQRQTHPIGWNGFD